MRAVFLLLLLANLTLIAAMKTGWEWQSGGQLQSQPILNEDKIRLIKEAELLPSSVPAPVPAPALPQPANAPAATNRTRSNFHMALSISSPVATPTNELVCIEWGDFSGADLSKVTKFLSGMGLGGKLVVRDVDRLVRYWVYMPPLPNKAAINRKISQLKERGINDYFVVQKPGDWHNAISLGVFKSRDAAENFLTELQVTRDVHTARVGERVEKQRATTFLLKDLGAATVTGINAMQKEFPDVELKNIPCAH